MMVKFTCEGCGKEYERSRTAKYYVDRKFCSRHCRKYRNEPNFLKYYNCLSANNKEKRKVTLSILRSEKHFSPHKHAYASKIIEYKESPTGKAYIGTAKQPLMPAETGHGYYGVLVQDEDRLIIQCHGCGKWLRKITSMHAKKCLGITVNEYKDKFGLNRGTGLVSDETSHRLTEACLKNTRRFDIRTKAGARGHRIRYTKDHDAVETLNKHGTCPLQLQERLRDFILCNREFPSSNNRGASVYKALRRRFGSFGHALLHYGLPYFQRTGTNMLYLFPDGTKYRYNINQMHDREQLYAMLMQKCTFLSKPSHATL
jgi:hypothetical protein